MKLIHGALLAVLLLLPAVAPGDTSEALYRLSIVTEALLEMGEEMLGDPVSGTITLGDTASVEMVLAMEYCYHLHIWTDASLNLMDFWITDPDGSIESASQGDHTSMVVFPDQAGEHALHMVLVEGWNEDTVGYAAALFRSPRQTITSVR